MGLWWSRRGFACHCRVASPQSLRYPITGPQLLVHDIGRGERNHLGSHAVSNAYPLPQPAALPKPLPPEAEIAMSDINPEDKQRRASNNQRRPLWDCPALLAPGFQSPQSDKIVIRPKNPGGVPI